MHSPYQKYPILTLPLNKTTIKNPKLLPLFVMNDKRQVTERFLEKDREKEQDKPCMPVGG